MKTFYGVLGALSISFLLGCTTVNVVNKYSGPQLPMPEQVLVYDLAVTPEEVKLDSGLSALAVEAMKSSSRTEQEIEAGHAAAAALSKELVKELQKMGLPASRAQAPYSMEENDVLISGQFVSVDEGNRTERVVIGLGAGRTDVRADVQMQQNGQELEAEDGDAKSARAPGMAETMGVGAVAGHLLVSTIVSTTVQAGSETFGSTIEADSSRMAKKIASDMKPFFIEQGWISAD